MAFTEAQQAILDRARNRLAGTVEEEERSQGGFTERQQAILDAARDRLGSGAPTPTDDVGFIGGLGNSVMRGLSNLRSIPDAMLTEEFAALADARAAQEAREAERARTGEDAPWWEKAATWRPSWAAEEATSEELRGKAAGLAQGIAQRSVDAQQNYPTTQAGEHISNITESGLVDGALLALRNPLKTASGVTQVVAEQIPTYAGAALATAVTKNPTAGIGVFAGSSYAQERFGQLVTEASKEGYNLLDRRGALDAVSDTEFMQDQASRGQTRGAIIGAVDLVTAGLASKAPLTIRDVAAQTGIQVAGGGGGEAAAQLATDGEIQGGEVLIEALAEGVSAPVDVATFALTRPASQGSDINTQEAQLRAEEDAQLEAQALAEEQAAGLRAQAEAETTARIRREAAATFTPRKKFTAGRQKRINDQLQADIRNPQTELGKAFEANLNEKGVFDPADVEAEAKAFLKGYQKETKAETDAQINEEYIAALDMHAEAVARGEVTAPQLDQDAEGDTAADAAPQENVAAPAAKPTKKEQLRADAVEKLGEDFEQNYPELSQLLSDGKGIYSRGKNKKSRFESMLDKAVAEQNTEAQPDAAQAQQPPVEAEQTATQAAQEDTATTPVVAKKEPTAAETLSSMDAQAETYAKEKLGDNWRESNPALVELLNGKKYAGFQTNVDRVAAEAPAAAEDVAQQIIDADPTPKEARNQKSFKESYAEKDGASSALFENPNLAEAAQMADWLGSLTQAQWDKINPAFTNALNPFKNPTNIDYKADRAKLEALLNTPDQTVATPATTDPTTDIAAVFTQTLPSDVKLSPNEQKVFDTMQQAFANNEQDDIIQSDGRLNPQRIADRAGMQSRQAAQTALTRLRPKLAKAYGVSQEQIKQRLAETKNKSSEAFDPNEAAAEVDLAELGSSMGTVASANQGARDGMAQEDRDFLDNMEDTPITPQERAELDAKRAEFDAEIKAHPMYKDVRANWDGFFEVDIENEADRVPFDTLDAGTRFDFFTSFLKYQSGDIDIDALGSEYDFLRRDYLKDVENEKTQAALERGQPQSEKSAEGLEPNRGEVREAGVDREQTPPTTAEFQERAANVQVETKKRKKIVRPKTTPPKFSMAEAEGNATSATASSVRDAVKWLIGKDVNWRVNVVSNPDDLIGMVLSKELNLDGSALGNILDRPNAQGVVVTDNDGVTRAFFFSDNIVPGTERGVVIHELGSHLGMDNVLTREQLGTAVGKIREWAKAPPKGLEKVVSERALARLESAEKQNAVADPDSELLAYFLEEAVNAGVTPNSESKSELVNFVRQIWADFKRALRKLRPANEAALTAQDLVNMARGAARLELATDFHGSTAAFRKANPDYFGLGNNAVGVGFYISEDQETGAGYMMQRMNERDSIGGALQRIDVTVAENEYLNWDAPMREQPAMLEVFNNLPDELQGALLEDFGSETVDALTGRQFYIGLTQQQLRDYAIEGYVEDAAYDRAQRHKRQTTTAMELVSSFLDGNGVKGIKTEIATNSTNPNPMFNKIIFNDKNVVVVGRNDAADVDTNTTTPGTIKFSVPEEETNKQVAWLRKNVSPAAGEAATNFLTAAKAPYTATKNLDRVIRENESKLPSARVWMDLMLAAEATRNQILGMVEGVVNQTRQFNLERKEMVNSFLGDSTYFQKWGYDPEWTDANGNKVNVKIDPIMKRKYDRLTAEEQQAVRDIFSHGRTLQLMMQDVAKDMGVSKFFKFDSKLEGPYAPLKRFGDYVGELKSQALLDAEAAVKEKPTAENRKKLEELKSDGDNYVISFFKSLGEAETFTEANKDKFAYVSAEEKLVDFDEARPGGAQAYEKIMGAVNANMAGLDQASKDAMAKMVRDMYFQTLDQSNARLSGARRLNRAGYEKDMIRSFAAHGMAQANLLAQMKHGGEISAALLEIKKEAKSNPKALNPVYNQIAMKFRRTMTPRTGMLANAEDALMKFNSFYMLTSSLGYFVQNMTQPYFAVANVAEVTGVSGQAAVWGKLFSGYGVAKKVINTSFLNQVKNVASLGLLGGNSTVEVNIDNAPPELRPLLKQMQDRGLLDVGITEDLRSLASEAGNMVTRGYDEMTHRLYQSARYVEANNRIASAVAAFRTAQQNPAKMKRLNMTPQEFALRIVQDTQGNFSKLDAPALFDALPKAPLQFRKYQFQMAFLHIDAAKQAYKGADRETQKAGMAKLGLMLGYTGVFGGLASVPMAGVANSVIQAILSGLDPEDDDELAPKRSLERWIRENVDDERTATLLSRGLPAALGWDFSQKLDQADLFMPYNSKYVQMDPSRDGALLFAAQLMLGPTGTMVGNAGNIADFVERGNLYRAGEYLMPKGLRSYMETMRYAQEGYKTRSDLVVADPTSFDLVDILTNAVGLPSTDINQIKWTRGQQVEIEQWFSSETTRITRGYRRAREDGDRKAQAEYREEFRELQRGKDRVRPFFNNSRDVLKRQSLGQLIRSPRRVRSDQRRLDSITGR